jgi:DNA-directed RNA polymerase subunit beta'
VASSWKFSGLFNKLAASSYGKVHFIPNKQNPIIKLGDKVRIGDPLSTGTLNPEKLVELKGAGAGRIYLAKKMRDIYSRSAQLDPRHFDIIARNMIKYHTVIDPGESGFAPGDKIDVNQLEEYLDNNSKVIDINHSIGKVLAKRVLDLTPGTEMTQNHIDDLKEKGIQEVPISTSGITVKPLVPGLQSLKLLDKNWISKLSFNQLHRVIQEAAAMSQKSPIHSTEPVTSYMIGNEFGEGNNGKY